MKKKIFAVALTCLISTGVEAQVYAYDSWVQMPTKDIYDDGMMNMYLRAVAETAARRKALFEQFSDRAAEAFKRKQWSLVICYVNDAFETQYYNGELYYLRGYAFEMLGDERQAKKDYRNGKRNNSYQAALALVQLKEKQRQRRKRK